MKTKKISSLMRLVSPLAADREAQSGAHLHSLSGEAGVEYLAQLLGRNSTAGVPQHGRLSVKQYNARVTLKEGTDNSVLREGGTSFSVHANGDDYATDPAGNAGAGIACGVIKTMAPQQARSSQPR